MYIFLLEDGEVKRSDKFSDDDKRMCDDGYLDAIWLREGTAPVRWWEGQWVEIERPVGRNREGRLVSSRYEALIMECHDNPMYTADMIVTLEKDIAEIKKASQELVGEINAIPTMRHRIYGANILRQCDKLDGLTKDTSK